MKEIIAKNTGNKIIINCASTREVLQLKQVIFNELTKRPLGLKLTKGSATDLLDKDVDFVGVLDYIKDTLLSLDGSDSFQDAIFNCLQYCTYKSTYKIDMDLFDNPAIPEAREDYYEILYSCIEENLRPFAKSLISMWKILVQEGKITQLLSIV